MSTEEKTRDREVVVPEPEGPVRAWPPIVGTLWVLVMLAIPLGYYTPGADPYDERFAWRMFSAVRVQRCELRVSEARAGGERPIPLAEVLPAPWIELLKRNRPAVIERFLRWRCEQREGTTRVRLLNECRDAAGAPVPAIDRAIDCESGEITSAEAAQ